MEPAVRHADVTSAPWDAARGRSRVAPWLLLLYIVVLACIAFWPTPVDRGVSPLLHHLIVEFHLVSYARIEFFANIVLFVPFGILLALTLRQRYLVVPISIVSTVGIESAQGIFLHQRVASLGDVVANLTGACVGLLIVALVEWTARRGRAIH